MQDLPEGIKVRVPFFQESVKQEKKRVKIHTSIPRKKEVFKNISQQVAVSVLCFMLLLFAEQRDKQFIELLLSCYSVFTSSVFYTSLLCSVQIVKVNQVIEAYSGHKSFMHCSRQMVTCHTTEEFLANIQKREIVSKKSSMVSANQRWSTSLNFIQQVFKKCEKNTRIRGQQLNWILITEPRRSYQ